MIVIGVIWLVCAFVMVAGVLGAGFSPRVYRFLYGEPLSASVPVNDRQNDHQP